MGRGAIWRLTAVHELVMRRCSEVPISLVGHGGCTRQESASDGESAQGRCQFRFLHGASFGRIASSSMRAAAEIPLKSAQPPVGAWRARRLAGPGGGAARSLDGGEAGASLAAGEGALRYQILGPFEVRHGRTQVALGSAKQRALLAILLVRANELVPSDRLIEELWPEPPETAANTLQVYVGRLRKALEPERTPGAPAELLVTQTPGYMLRVEPDELDADRFERLLDQGRTAREAEDNDIAARRFHEALELWEGPALADFIYDPFAQAEIARLEELRLDAVEECIEADLALGKAGDLVGRLEGLVRDHPLRERLRGQLMLALYRSGRQADALEVYRETSRTLDEELGIAPSPPLQRLQTAILRHEPSLELSIEAAPAEPLGAPEPESPDAAAEAASEVRKTVTVLVARRPSPRGLDPEAIASEDDRLGAELERAVERYGGTVLSRSGNSGIAVFGVPRVHEDDPLWAASAALEIRDRATGGEGDSGSGPRFGIATGEVLASASDAGVSVVGEPLTAAADLAAAAVAGEILLDQETQGVVSASAKAEPVETESGRAWLLHDLAHERPAVGSFKAPLVGRGRELARLRRAFEDASRLGTLHLVRVLGQPGIGKSRLAQELASEVAERATVVVGRCVPYGEGITFWSLREIVGRLSAAGPPGQVLADGSEPRRLADGLMEAIGVAQTSSEREEIFWATRRLFEALARERPLLVFFEDLHWAEPTFLDLIEYLAERVRRAPVLLVCIARPELLEERPDWSRETQETSTLQLEPLPARDCEALIAELAGGLGRSAKSRVLETAEGNPLFIEQLVAMLREGGGEEAELPVPPTIAALLSARLDRLGPGERAVITRAAVVGKEFSARAVLDLLPDDARPFAVRHTETRVSKELIGRARSTRDGESYQFRHILIQQAAYRAIPKRIRAELHERFATTLDHPTPGDAIAGKTEIVGYHLEQAFRLRAELGSVGDHELDLAQRARDHLASAGRGAFQRGDMPATVNLLGRAASLPTKDDATGFPAQAELGYALFETGEADKASTVLAEGRARARAAGDRHQEWLLAATRARVALSTDPEGIDLDAIGADTETAIEVLAELGDEAGLARAWMVHSDLLWSKWQLRETSEAATRAAEHARRTGNRREVGWALGQIALCAIHGPVPVAEGLRWLERLIRAEPENRTLDANLSGFITVLEAMSGRFAEARRHIEKTRALARDLGLRWQAAVQELLSGYIELMAGDPAAAERYMRKAERSFREMGEGWFLSTVAVDLPRAVYEQGRYDDAFALLDAVEDVPAPTDREWQIKRTGVPARLLARRGQLEEAEELARQGVALAASSEFVVLHADVLLDLAEVLWLAGRGEDAAMTAAEAVSLYERKGDVASARSARSLAYSGQRREMSRDR